MCNAKNPHWIETTGEDEKRKKTPALTMSEIEKRMEEMGRSTE